MRLLRRFSRSTSDAGLADDAPGFDWDDEGSELEMQLRRFAADDLSADEATLSRIELRAMAAFVESAAPPRRSAWNRRRAVATIGAVAVLMLSTVGLATAESGPGQPFYRLRLGLESVNLPAAGSESRLDADLDRGAARLDDIAHEAANSMWSGAADAAGAYVDAMSGITLPVDAAAGAAGNSAVARLQAQLARLVQFRAASHDPETAQLDRAIALVAEILGVPVPVPAQSAMPAGRPKSTDHEAATDSEAPEANPTDPRRSTEPQESDRPHPDASGTPPAGPGDGGSGDGGSGGQGDHGGRGDASPSPAPSQSPDPSAPPTPSGRSWNTPAPSGRQSN